MKREFIAAVQRHVARVSIVPSAVRGQRSPGLAAAARDFLCVMSLAPLLRAMQSFASQLDTAAAELEVALPKAGRSWGIARKALNIFFRNALYTSYLNDRFVLARAEHFYEVPLDSIVAARRADDACEIGLGPWCGVKYLTPAVNAEYQELARRQAATMGIAPVHLDVYWWGGSRDGAARDAEPRRHS